MNEDNRRLGPHAAGKAKVVHTQLNSTVRIELVRAQGIECSSVYSQVDALVLPEVLALVGEAHGQTELYHMLIAIVPELASIVNRKVIVQQKLAEKSAQMDAIRAEMDNLSKELASIELSEASYSLAGNEDKHPMHRRKRERNDVD